MILEISQSNGYNSVKADNYNMTRFQTSKTDFMEVIHMKVEQMQEKLEEGNVNEEPAVLTGGQAFTEREWKELITGYDRVQDKFRELMRERHELQETKREKQRELAEI